LFVNESKTEKYTISKNSTNEWKDCKLVGSKLETVNDMENRKKLANFSMSTLKPILSAKESQTDVKLSIFNALIESIFLYNSEIWSLTQTLEKEIDVFQRRLLRKTMGYRYTENREYWPSNDRLYKETKQTPWSVKIAKRRLSFFGHVCRLPETTPVKIALREALRPAKNPQGRPKTTYIKVIETQLK